MVILWPAKNLDFHDTDTLPLLHLAFSYWDLCMPCIGFEMIVLVTIRHKKNSSNLEFNANFYRQKSPVK